MSCEDFEQRLNEVLDDRLDPAADHLLVEHSQRCPECQRLLAIQSQCFAALNGALSLSPSLRGRSSHGRSLLGEASGQAESLGAVSGHCLPVAEKGLAAVHGQQAKRGGRWKRWSAMVSPLAVSAALAVVMWSAGQRPQEQVPQHHVTQDQVAQDQVAKGQSPRSGGTRGAVVADRGGWRGTGVLAWSGLRGRASANAREAAAFQREKNLVISESDAGGIGQVDGLLATAVPAASASAEGVSAAVSTPTMSMSVVSGLSAGAQGVRRIAGETDLLFGERLNQWRESIALLPPTRLESVVYWAEGMRPVADSVGSLVEAVRESVIVGRSDRSESSLDTTWVIHAKWVA
ncbi:MAG: hypothetical protein U1A77_03960 [Pirellulales bacterium]